MKLSVAIASLLLVTSTALPAFAAVPASISLRDAATAPTETVQYRPTPHQAHGAQSSAHAVNRKIIPGSRCVSRDLGEGNYSAYPAWEVCD